MNRYDEPSTSEPPYWKLDSTHLFGASYSFSGYRNYSTYLQPLEFNYSQCLSSSNSEYGGYILEPQKRRSSLDSLNVTEYPRVSGRFDNNSASFEITGIFRGNSFSQAGGNTSYLGGPITISFLGTLDGNRSDTLMTSSNDTPVWNETLGYSKTIYGDSVPNGGRGRVIDMWIYGFSMFCVLLWLL
jgi:hypothetical protein